MIIMMKREMGEKSNIQCWPICIFVDVSLEEKWEMKVINIMKLQQPSLPEIFVYSVVGVLLQSDKTVH